MVDKQPERIAEALGASRFAEIQVGHGPFGCEQLLTEIQRRFGACTTRGRPSDPEWSVHRLVGFKAQTWNRLNEMAQELSQHEYHISPGQVAAILIEKSLGKAQ